MHITRRKLLQLGTLAGAATVLRRPDLAFGQAAPSLITRAIPSTGERIPAIGVSISDWNAGSDWSAGGVRPASELAAVLNQLVQAGAKLVEAFSPYRGDGSDALLGEVAVQQGVRDKLFLATAIAVSGRQAGLVYIEQCFRRMRTDVIDLICLSNLFDAAAQMQNLRSFKDAGTLRYVCAAALAEQQFDDLEHLMKSEAMNFVRVDYSLENRGAAQRVLPLAQDRALAALIRSPFGRGGHMMAAARRHPLPEWAQEIGCTNWPQFFLKYTLSQPAVTCIVPSIRSFVEVQDYLAGAREPLPDAGMRLRMERFVDELQPF